jgi:arsenite methyltransferase
MNEDVREAVRARYAAAATAVTTGRSTCCGGSSCCGPAGDAGAGPQAGAGQETAVGLGEPAAGTAPPAEDTPVGAALYSIEERGELPENAVAASLGCGNPIFVADLHAGETVLDLGSGGGIDVLLSARRVGPDGRAYGLDMTDEMLDLARSNAAAAGTGNVEFLKGHIEDIPLPEGSVDVVISNCVINLSTNKPAVFRQMFRVLKPGGRVGVSDIVAEDRLTPQQRAERGDWASCAAGALSRTEYEEGLRAAGFTGVQVAFTQEVADGLHSAIVRATKPAASRT